MRTRSIAGCLLLALLLAPASEADVVVPRKGKPIRGHVRRDGDRVVVNPYHATTPEMTWGVVELAADDVEEIRAEGPRELPPGLAEPWDDRPELRRALGAILTRDSAMARWDGSNELRAEYDVHFGPGLVEPLARSWRAPRGTRHEVPMGRGTYSVHVPEIYHPLEPLPVVVGLHGGLHRRKEDGRYVFLSTARDVFALLEGEAKQRGWILVCPHALEAPWKPRQTIELVEAVLADVESSYAVDRARRYVVGFGAGADAALALAAARPKAFAAVGAASADDPALVRAASGRRVPVWLYHGEECDRTAVAEARKAADALRRKRARFAYLELPGEGHGLPRIAEADLYRFLAGHASTLHPDSSLADGVEGHADGVPWAHVWGYLNRLPTPELIARLRRGAWDAEAAARGLLGADPAPEAGRIAAILANRAVPASGRRWAAWLLGWLGEESAVPALGDALRGEADPEVRRAAARALRLLRPAEASGDLWQAFDDATRAFSHEEPPATLPSWRRTLLLAADVIEALALAVESGDELLPEIEEKALIGLLKEGTVPPARRELGEDAGPVRVRLARAIGRAYRKLDAEPTLLEMLRVVLRRDPALLRAANEGYEEGLAKGPDRSAHRPRWD